MAQEIHKLTHVKKCTFCQFFLILNSRNFHFQLAKLLREKVKFIDFISKSSTLKIIIIFEIVVITSCEFDAETYQKLFCMRAFTQFFFSYLSYLELMWMTQLGAHPQLPPPPPAIVCYVLTATKSIEGVHKNVFSLGASKKFTKILVGAENQTVDLLDLARKHKN